MVKYPFIFGLAFASLFTSHTAQAQLFPDRQQIDQWLVGLGGENNFDRSKTIDWGVLPGPFYTPELELGVGIALVGLYQADSRPDSKISSLSLSGFGSSTGAFGMTFSNYTYLANDTWRFYLTGTLNNVPTNYWGEGYHEGRVKDHFGEFRSQELRLTPTLLRQITKNTYIGLGWDYSNLQAAAPDNPFKDYMNARDLPLRSTSSGLTVRFTYDSRDFLPNAYQGQAFDISYTHYSPDTGSNNRFNATQIQYNYYYPLSDNAVLAFDNYARFTSGDVPWSQLSKLSNGQQMRGYYEGRYQDNHVFSTQLEYRQKLDWRHGIALWVGGGTLSDQARDLGKGHWLPSVGVGYRFEFKPRMNVRLDFGIGKESTGFYFQVGEAF
ncbi:BamA/TamA family outer membrane protein [Proteus terrae]|uniref:BamA/TamA family outer membrane protein n=1 Tax=Proteus terrae TaxID=1574161 RepID=UPI00370C1475